MADLVNFSGRLHPVLVHAPIGFFLLYAALEVGSLLARKRSLSWLPLIPAPLRTFVLALLAIAAVLTAMTGWNRAVGGGFDEPALAFHRWLGTGFAGCTVLLFFAHLGGRERFYALLIAVSAGVVVLTGHFGAVLTHGADYFSDRPAVARGGSATAQRRPATDAAHAEVFADVVAPILAEHCSGCHGPRKSNGDLRLDSLAQLLAGGKGGAAITPGDASRSRLIQRLHLPLANKEHMPPKNKPQLAAADIALLEWWVEAGGPAQAKLVDLEVPAAIAEALRERFPFLVQKKPGFDRVAIMAAAAATARELGIVIRPLAQDQPWLVVNARLRGKAFDDHGLAALASLAPAVHWLDLGETGVTDAGLVHLAGMRQLRRLQLDRTAVTDAGLPCVAILPNIESLNLYGTGITDKGIAALTPLKRLRSLYLWQTAVSAGAVERLAEKVADQGRLERLQRELFEVRRRMEAEEFRADFGTTTPVPRHAEAGKAAAPVSPLANEADPVQP